MPQCVLDAVAQAEDLYALIHRLDQEFPDLPVDAPRTEQAIDVVLAISKWAEKMEASHAELVCHFPHPEQGVRTELPSPDYLLMQRHQHIAEGKIDLRRPDLDIASDVLEPLPARFRNSMVGTLPFEIPRILGSEESGSERVAAAIANTLQVQWPVSRTRLTTWRFVVRSKLLRLVGWVRQQAADLRNAAFPDIYWTRRDKNKGHILSVNMAGASRDVRVSNAEHHFLLQLSKGSASATRTLKSGLMKKLPEIQPYITSLGTRMKGTSYDVVGDMRDRLRVAPPR
jgi:hypothetical protein